LWKSNTDIQYIFKLYTDSVDMYIYYKCRMLLELTSNLWTANMYVAAKNYDHSVEQTLLLQYYRFLRTITAHKMLGAEK